MDLKIKVKIKEESKEIQEKLQENLEAKAFKSPIVKEQLKTNVWYKSGIDDCLVYRTGDQKNVGFLNKTYHEGLKCFTPTEWEEADSDEVKELLTKECEKRGIWNVPVISAEGETVGDCEFYNEEYNSIDNLLWSKYEVVWCKGVFAKPVPKKMTLEERVERLEKLNNL